MRDARTAPWGLILAGGDGVRLRPLTRQIVGDPRPKQFCPMLDGETLFEVTRRRVSRLIRPERHVVVVTRAHEPYYRPFSAGLSHARLVVQPDNKGTGPGILYPLLRLSGLAGDVPVAVFPSDHWVSDDLAFMRHVQQAIDVVREHPQMVIVLGIAPNAPEAEYGWIEPTSVPLPRSRTEAFPVRRFWEKPSEAVATRLMGQGCLWNSFAMVGWVRTFLALFWQATPELVMAFDRGRRSFGTGAEAGAVEALYAGIREVSFSDEVLARVTGRLAVLTLKDVDWSDWGNPDRVLATVRRRGWTPAWLSRIELAAG